MILTQRATDAILDAYNHMDIASYEKGRFIEATINMITKMRTDLKRVRIPLCAPVSYEAGLPDKICEPNTITFINRSGVLDIEE